ncbi:MAG: hypothetical protein QOK37_2213 [Thermoanaerobaculia bacterium]|jgi:proteasome lid subunit RPN8/RPN11|nr:hypothetical protein [Thermoanaerobaculia bacterium]
MWQRCLWVLLYLLINVSNQTKSIRLDAGDVLNDATLRAYFADLLRQGGFGHWKTERAAFIVRDEDGHYRCIAWPMDGHLYRQQFHGIRPDRTAAVIHTHPSERPLASSDDERMAIKLSLPIVVLTPRNIYMITAGGETIPIVQNHMWATFAEASPMRCSASPSTAPTVAGIMRVPAGMPALRP